MAQPQIFEIDLSRYDGSVSWGFRLQGGADFSTPLSIQLVQPESVADQCGLQAGDGILQINGLATETLDHESAKMEIVRAGNNVKFLIQRGAVTTWRPRVTPMSELKPAELQTHALPGEAPPVQKTSLAANRQPVQHIGSAHNRSARPFGASGPGGTSISPERHISVKDSFPNRNVDHYSQSQAQREYQSDCGGFVPDVDYNVNQSQRLNPGASRPQGIVHAQFNSPVGMYSDNNVNDSFNQQADAMRNQFGNMSVKAPEQTSIAQPARPNGQNINNNNVMKTQPASLPAPNTPELRKSPVMMAVEAETEPEPSLYKGGKIQSKTFKMLEQELEDGATRESVFAGESGSNSLPAGMRSVQPPKPGQNKMTGPKWKQPTSSCYMCNQPITGVFVRVKDHCLHADCLRCAQCKRSLKNIGYIWVKDTIYCVQHARELTRPPGGGYTAYVIDAPDSM